MHPEAPLRQNVNVPEAQPQRLSLDTKIQREHHPKHKHLVLIIICWQQMSGFLTGDQPHDLEVNDKVPTDSYRFTKRKKARRKQ